MLHVFVASAYAAVFCCVLLLCFYVLVFAG
jgi:hypothetical protein